MSEIKCPHCGEVFKVDEQGYAAIVAQVKTAEFDKELDKRVADEKDKALKLAKLDFDSKYTKAVNDKDMEIQKLKAAAANGESEKTLAVTKAQENTRAEYEKTLEQLKKQISQNEKLIAQLTAQTKSMTTEKELAISMAVEKARSQFNSEKDKLRQEISQRDMQIQQLNSEHTLQMQKSENEYKAEITRLETDIKNKDTEKALELTTALSKVESEKNSTIADLNAQIKSKDEAIAYYKDLKSRLSTKMVGESLEQHCMNEFNKIRATAFRNAYFDKDNDASSGSKGDFIYRECDENGVEILKKAIEQDIHKFSHIPCMSDESFGGNVSGVAMEFKLLGMENITKIKTRYYKKGLRKRVRIFCNYLALHGTSIDPSGITMTFTRALPKNLLEISQIVANLWGKVSRKTLLSQVPFVEDVDEELKALETEEEENLKRQQEVFGMQDNTPPEQNPDDKEKVNE